MVENRPGEQQFGIVARTCYSHLQLRTASQRRLLVWMKKSTQICIRDLRSTECLATIEKHPPDKNDRQTNSNWVTILRISFLPCCLTPLPQERDVQDVDNHGSLCKMTPSSSFSTERGCFKNHTRTRASCHQRIRATKFWRIISADSVCIYLYFWCNHLLVSAYRSTKLTYYWHSQRAGWVLEAPTRGSAHLMPSLLILPLSTSQDLMVTQASGPQTLPPTSTVRAM